MTLPNDQMNKKNLAQNAVPSKHSSKRVSFAGHFEDLMVYDTIKSSKSYAFIDF